MKLTTLYLTSIALLPSLIAAVAIPDVSPRDGALSKRGGEVVYLADCTRTDVSSGSSYPASYGAWYADVDNSLSGNVRPDDLSNEYRDWSNGGTYLRWEGSEQDVHWKDSDVVVQTHIDTDAQSRDFAAWAGWAQRTSDGKTFNCYKDNYRQLFYWAPPVPDGTNNSIYCWSIYWCV
ncbi:hypothetical protein M407DRAFT_105105 [Tulasnella calospora MUT 4182]|uniref:Uncharacterized protein n=1 Tax=Tulasnella calospora MUT 4182 TaxID=1051891 RepID=A0A0C3QTJ2_9AGAM|nr:hypothetical protein M407DRAFT_105105 [Tulasnella calospora MUT 4182]